VIYIIIAGIIFRGIEQGNFSILKFYIGFAFSNQKMLNAIKGTDLAWYKKRNAYMINHFDNANYPDNVHLLKPQDVFCDTQNCYATWDNVPLYFDNNHPSVLGAKHLVDLIKIEGK